MAEYVWLASAGSFVVGEGVGYDEKYRKLPYVGIWKPAVYGGE